MTAPRHRSRSMRRVKVVTPGGKTVTHYRPRKHNRAQCGKCGAGLQAVATGSKPMMKRSKSERRPSRPYGGVLCSRCTRALLKQKARTIPG